MTISLPAILSQIPLNCTELNTCFQEGWRPQEALLWALQAGMWCFALGQQGRRASRPSMLSTKTGSALVGTCTAILTGCMRSEDHRARPRIHPHKRSQWCGSWCAPPPPTHTHTYTHSVCNWELVAGERLSGPHQGSMEALANCFLPRAGAWQ